MKYIEFEIERDGKKFKLTEDEMNEARIINEINWISDYLYDYENLRHKDTDKPVTEEEILEMSKRIYEAREKAWSNIDDLGAIECSCIEDEILNSNLIYD